MTVTAATTPRERMLLAKDAARVVALLDDRRKRALLHAMADAIDDATPVIVSANAEDLERGRGDGLSEALQDRLRLDADRVSALANAVRDVGALPDPVGRVL
ncbi:MAG: gamma-glutamyl-phosphate reductase, partial [Microbacterium sp.]|nr:gamma-glutamyl-phosphate reductase [Microbacterium sp.]